MIVILKQNDGKEERDINMIDSSKDKYKYKHLYKKVQQGEDEVKRSVMRMPAVVVAATTMKVVMMTMKISLGQNLVHHSNHNHGTILKVMLVTTATTMKVLMIIRMKIRAVAATVGIAMIILVAIAITTSGIRSRSTSNENVTNQNKDNILQDIDVKMNAIVVVVEGELMEIPISTTVIMRIKIISSIFKKRRGKNGDGGVMTHKIDGKYVCCWYNVGLFFTRIWQSYDNCCCCVWK